MLNKEAPAKPEEKETKEKAKRKRWNTQQSEVLVSLWNSNFDNLTLSKCNQVCLKIVKEISSHGLEKTMQSENQKLERCIQNV